MRYLKTKTLLCDTETGCGISYIWMLPPDHPFTPACAWHDERYELKDCSRVDADLGLYQRCLAVAGDSIKLKAEAYLFWFICRSVGWLWW